VSADARVGHAYSTLSPAQDHQDTGGRKLWEAVLALKESADIAENGGTNGQVANSRREQALIIREMLNGEPTQAK
jgi:hypothetical protein